MATEFFFDIEGKRLPMRAPELLPRVGDTMKLTLYRKLRAETYLVERVEWIMAQEETAAYFNRPRSIVLYLQQSAGKAGDDEEEPKG